ncbi:MAG TPA: glycosyltransferase family 4 protein [Myxococcales bacterium]|nr:glycosyltransferase family 4 protein [Myxococcales bacterium]
MDGTIANPARPQVLALLPGVPVPANTGGAQRALTMVQALDAAFDTTVLAWTRPGEDPQELQRMLAGRLYVADRMAKVDSLFAEGMGLVLGCPAGYCRYGWFPSLLKQLLGRDRYDFIHFDHPHTALTWPQIRRLQPQAKLVLDAHNVEAEIMERLADSAPRWQRKAMRWQAGRIRQLERELARNLDLVFTCSERDAAAFREMGARRVRVVPNATPALSPPLVAQRHDVVFIGSLDWRPNADAAVALAREIWPRCRALLPGSRLVIVGRNPPLHVQALASHDVIIAGSVPSVRPYLDRAFATAIPLRAGSGTRIKILEAWAAGVPVVASRIAAEGLPCTDGIDLILAEEASEFARALVRLWRDRQLAEELAEEGRRTVAPFTAARVAREVERDYRELLRRESARPYSEAYAPAMAATS